MTKTEAGLTIDTWATVQDGCPMDYEIDVSVVRLQLGGPSSPLTISVDREGAARLEALVGAAKAALIKHLDEQDAKYLFRPAIAVEQAQ